MPGPDSKPISNDATSPTAAPLNTETQGGFRGALEVQTRMMSSLIQINQDMFEFMSWRMKRYQETANEMAACKTPQDAVSVCTSFAETARKDYSEGFGEIIESCVEQTREAMQDVQHQVETLITSASPKGA